MRTFRDGNLARTGESRRAPAGPGCKNTWRLKELEVDDLEGDGEAGAEPGAGHPGEGLEELVRVHLLAKALEICVVSLERLDPSGEVVGHVDAVIGDR